ncbi:MAG: hypothetical protein QM758_09375, partial [Armatimonas sp.]
FGQPCLRNVHRLMQRAPKLGTMAAKRIRHGFTIPDLTPQPLRLVTDLYTAQWYVPQHYRPEVRAKR